MRLFLAVAMLIGMTAQAYAASCLPTRTMVSGLKSAFGEVPRLTGMTSKVPIVLFSNPETGTFTVVTVGPEQSCILMVGDGFEIIDIGDPT